MPLSLCLFCIPKWTFTYPSWWSKESAHTVDWRSSEPIRGIFTPWFAPFAGQNLRARGEGSVVNYPRGAGSNADCAPHSAGNRGTPEGQARAWGRSGWERRNKAEKGSSLVLSNGMREHCRNTDPIFAFKTSVISFVTYSIIRIIIHY